jgi:hypothetical protein
MKNRNALFSALILGTVLQLVMVIAGHFSAFVRNDVFAFGGMAISLVAGFYFGWRVGGGWVERLTGGAIAGAGCALIGIAVSVMLKDTALLILAVGTISSAVTGLIGGAASKLLR